MRISDWSSDVCSSDLISLHRQDAASLIDTVLPTIPKRSLVYLDPPYYLKGKGLYEHHYEHDDHAGIAKKVRKIKKSWIRSEEHTSELQSLMRISYAVFCLKKKKKKITI